MGFFLPRDSLSKLKVRSEDISGHYNYLPVNNSDNVSPFEQIDLEDTVISSPSSIFVWCQSTSPAPPVPVVLPTASLILVLV